MVKRYCLILCSVTLILFAFEAQAAPSVSADVSSRRITEGEQLILEIAVYNGSPRYPDTSSLFNDFSVSPPKKGFLQQLETVNGRTTTTNKHTITYELVPKKIGSLTIPALDVVVDDTVCRTMPITITVIKASQAERLEFFMKFSRTTCYVDEAMPVTLELLSGKMPAQLNIGRLPLLNDKRFEVKFFSTDWHVGSRDVDGYSLHSVTRKGLVISKAAGKYRITGPVSILMPSKNAARARDFFGNPFGQPQGQTMTINMAEVLLTVKDLPQEGRPPDFSGIIGQPTVSADARPKEVSIGEPIDFVIQISGLPYLEDIAPVYLEKQPQFDENFKVQDDGLGGSREGNALVFRRTLRAKNDKATQIPPFKLSFFNTNTGKYEYKETPPIPLKVNPTRVVSFEDGTGGGIIAPDKVELESSLTGIAGNENGLDVMNDEYFAASEAICCSGWLAVIILPFAVYIILLAGIKMAERRDQDESGIRRRRAFGKVKKGLHGLSGKGTDPDFPEKISRIIYEYVGDRLTRNAAALTPQDSAQLLQQAGAEDGDCSAVRSLLEDLEAARFGGWQGSDDRTVTLKRTLELLRRLERSL